MPAASRDLPRVLLAGIGLELSGSGRFLTGLAAGLARDGFDTHLFVVRGGLLAADLEGTGVKLTVAAPELSERAGRLRLGAAPLLRLASLVREVRPDVLHTNLFGIDVIGRTAAVGSGVPVVMSTQHDINPRPPTVDAYRRATVARIAATVAVSEPVGEYCRDVMHVPEELLFVIENGIDTARLEAAVVPIRTPATFLTMGGLVAPKGHATLIEAFARVAEARPGVSLTISGHGPLRDDLLGRIDALGLDGVVRIVDPTPDIVGLLRGADVFVQPSLREGLPQAMLEAMAAAKPVVATDVSSHASVLDGGRCGRLVPPEDPAALAAAMLDIVGDVEAAAAMGRAGRDRVRARYSLGRMVGEYEALYGRLVSSARARG